MRTARLRGDLSLLRQGVDVAIGFGVRSLGGLVSVAELLESSVYERGSLTATPSGFSFTFLNPPLRMGAFSALRLSWNGARVPPEDAQVRTTGSAQPRSFASVDRAHPFVLPVGARTHFEVHLPRAEPGTQRVRLELESVAIPPLVWFEFAEVARSPGAAP